MYIHAVFTRNTSYTPELLPFSAILDLFENDPGIDAYTVLLIDNETTYLVDFNKVYSAQPHIRTYTTWTQFINFLTPEFIANYRSYATPQQYTLSGIEDGVNIYTYTFDRAVHPIVAEATPVGAEHTLGVNLFLGSHTNPNYNNNPIFYWRCPDIVISQDVGSDVVDLNTTVPIVNGYVCYPKVIDNELYGYMGAEVSRNNHYYNKSVVLLDFSTLGTVEFIKLSDCTDSRSDTQSTRIVFDLPATINSKNKTPIVVIGGRMFFPDEFTFNAKSSGGRIDLPIIPTHLGEILISNASLFGRTIKYTDILTVSVSYFAEHLFNNKENLVPPYADESRAFYEYADTGTPFVILVDTPMIKRHTYKPRLSIGQELLLFQANSGGLLYNPRTREIMDYNVIEFDNNSLVMVAGRPKLFRLSNMPKVSKQFGGLYDPTYNYIPERNFMLGFHNLYIPRQDNYNTMWERILLRDLNTYELMDITI